MPILSESAFFRLSRLVTPAGGAGLQQECATAERRLSVARSCKRWRGAAAGVRHGRMPPVRIAAIRGALLLQPRATCRVSRLPQRGGALPHTPAPRDRVEGDADIEAVEAVLSAAMAQLASTDGQKRVTQGDVDAAEALCDKYVGYASAWKPRFVLPGAAPASSALHVARTVARRCERCVLRYAESEPADPVDPALLRYLNRVSDLLYAMAVYLDFRADALE